MYATEGFEGSSRALQHNLSRALLVLVECFIKFQGSRPQRCRAPGSIDNVWTVSTWIEQIRCSVQQAILWPYLLICAQIAAINPQTTWLMKCPKASNHQTRAHRLENGTVESVLALCHLNAVPPPPTHWRLFSFLDPRDLELAPLQRDQRPPTHCGHLDTR